MRLLVRVFVGTLVLMLAGCMSLDVPRSPNTVSAVNATYVDSFYLNGRISVRSAGGASGEPARIDTARIEWLRTPTRDLMRFFTPFGSQLAEIDATPERSVLTRGDQTEVASSFAQLSASQLGVAIDAKVLARWVQGLDLDKGPVFVRLGGDAPRQWSITAENFQSVPNAAGAHFATRVIASDGEVTLRIVVDDFKLP